MEPLGLHPDFALAVQLHQSGRLREAEQIYQKILAQQPDNAAVIFNLALLAHHFGRLPEAIALLYQVVALSPQYAEAYSNLGSLLRASGQVAQAIEIHRKAIALKPDYAQAHNNLANALKDAGQLDDSIAAFRRAIALNPNYVEAHNNLGVAFQKAGRPNEAIAAHRRAIALNSNYPEAYSNLGVALRDAGQLPDAIAAFHTAVTLKPANAEAHNNLGVTLKDAGQLDNAIAAFRQAVALDPAYAEAHSNLGASLRDAGNLDDAIAACRQALAHKPNFAPAHCNLGNALKDGKRTTDAIAAYQQAIALKPDYAEAHYNLGNIYLDMGQLLPAIAAFRQALAHNPNFAEAHGNLGAALRDARQLDESIAAFRRAIELKPNLAEAHWGLSMALLHGDLKQGWQEYEWRWKVTAKSMPRLRDFSQPLWDGSELKGRTILIHAEQGYGDTIQFSRYASLVNRSGGQVIVEAQKSLIRLLRQLSGVEDWIAQGDPLPAFDLHCPLMSLPRIYGTELQTIPAQTEPLRPEALLLENWRRRLADGRPGLKVAINWAGNPDFKGDRTRSITLDRLARFTAVSGVTFYSLQKGAAAAQCDRAPAGLPLVNLAPELHDFADTAAVMSLMDLVITTDTSVAHLAGALGRPVWVMLQYMPDWRWFLDRTDSPWYPNMRLMRQKRLGDWDGLITEVAEALADYAQHRIDRTVSLSPR